MCIVYSILYYIIGIGTYMRTSQLVWFAVGRVTGAAVE